MSTREDDNNTLSLHNAKMMKHMNAIRISWNEKYKIIDKLKNKLLHIYKL